MNKTYTKVFSQQHSTYYHLKIRMSRYICCAFLSIHTRRCMPHKHKKMKRFCPPKAKYVNGGGVRLNGDRCFSFSLNRSDSDEAYIIKYKLEMYGCCCKGDLYLNAEWVDGGHHHHASHIQQAREKQIYCSTKTI